MKDIKDFIKIADVFGKEHAKTTDQVNENFVDNFLNFLGLRDDEETTEIVTDLSKKLTQKQKDALAGKLDTPPTDTSSNDNQAQSDDAQDQGNASYQDDAQATDSSTPSKGGSLLGRKLDTTTPNLMQAYNDGGKKAMPAIRNLQTALTRLGFDPNGLDGKYGQGTFAAVQAFQKANGLSVDGQAGPNTMAALKKALDDKFEKNAVKPGDAGADDAEADQQADAQAQGDTSAADNQAAADDAQDQGNASYQDDAQATATKSGASQAPTLKQKIDRFNELLRKAQESDEAGVPNAERDSQERGVQVASVDFRHLISLVENVINEALTPEEEKELQALFRELQGQVGVEPDLDQSIEDALNNYIKVKGDPKLQNQRGFDPNASNTDDAYANDAQATDPKLQNKRGFDPNKKEGPTLDSLAGQIKQGIKKIRYKSKATTKHSRL